MVNSDVNGVLFTPPKITFSHITSRWFKMKKFLIGFIAFLLLAFGFGYYYFHSTFHYRTKTEIHKSKPKNELKVFDDKLNEKSAPFDSEFVDRREHQGWQVNSSGVILSLDCPDMLREGDKLYSNFLAATKDSSDILPSINMLDASTKPFDDGLYAAIDVALFHGKLAGKPSIFKLTNSIFQNIPEGSPARPFLAAALELTEDSDLRPKLTKNDETKKGLYLSDFQSNDRNSKPMSFYTWNDDLKRIWRFSNFLQQPLPTSGPIATDIRKALDSDTKLRDDYLFVQQFYGQLTNPHSRPDIFRATDKENNSKSPMCSFFPPSTSRELELYRKSFPLGAPANSNLIALLIKSIRSGEVNLQPKKGSGWYDYQVHALEALLLPSKTEGYNKLKLSKRYKLRLMEAFKSIIAKKRELHLRNAGQETTSAPKRLRPEFISPRLRLEPNPTFYLRTARAYSFLHTFLISMADQTAFDQLHALSEDGPRKKKLLAELKEMRKRFYGLYIVCCDDIGIRPKLDDQENVDQDECYEMASSYLKNILSDPSLAKDVRFSIPIYQGKRRKQSKFWSVIGVRKVRLRTSFAKGPKIRENDSSDWTHVRATGKDYYLLVDQFAEYSSSKTMNRKQFQSFCDQHDSQSDILNALKSDN